MVEELKKDIEIYNKLMEEFKRLDSSDFTTAYRLSQTALTTADRWNEIMLNSVKYAKETQYTKSEITSYCYQKYKILIKIHDICRMIYRTGAYEINNYGKDL